jgi:hypothetical protein
VHVDRERGRWRTVRQALLLLGDLGQREAEAAEVLGYGDLQVARRAQLVKILLKEPIFAIIGWCPLAEAQQHLVRQDWLACNASGWCGECRHRLLSSDA